MHVYEVRPRKDRRGFDLISDALTADFGVNGKLAGKESARLK
jgi:hypothetical protein